MRVVEIASTLNIGCSVCGARAIQVLVDEIRDSNAQYVLAEIVESQCAEHAQVAKERSDA